MPSPDDHAAERAALLKADRQLEKIRDRYPAWRILRAPWGWEAYEPGHEDVIRAGDLDGLDARLAAETRGGE
jgi:hypothetical protein